MVYSVMSSDSWDRLVSKSSYYLLVIEIGLNLSFPHSLIYKTRITTCSLELSWQIVSTKWTFAIFRWRTMTIFLPFADEKLYSTLKGITKYIVNSLHIYFKFCSWRKNRKMFESTTLYHFNQMSIKVKKIFNEQTVLASWVLLVNHKMMRKSLPFTTFRYAYASHWFSYAIRRLMM